MILKFNIKLIFCGENGEVEYAGNPEEVDELSDTSRGSGGFGSTGLK